MLTELASSPIGTRAIRNRVKKEQRQSPLAMSRSQCHCINLLQIEQILQADGLHPSHYGFKVLADCISPADVVFGPNWGVARPAGASLL